MNTLSAFWWSGHPNFGDALTPFLLEAVSEVESAYARVEDAEIVVLGSVLDVLPKGWGGIVAGAGKLFESTVPDLSAATVLGLRGALSAKGIRGDYVLGDPALIVDELVAPSETKYDLGVVPHWSDTELAGRFAQWSPHVIDPTGDSATVVSEIASCKKIVASSLHGIIVADAYGIPRRAEMFSQAEREGGDFKFRDYASVIGQEIEFGTLQTPPRWRIEELQRGIYDMLRSIS